MLLVPLFDLKFLLEVAATAVGTSNRRQLAVARNLHIGPAALGYHRLRRQGAAVRNAGFAAIWRFRCKRFCTGQPCLGCWSVRPPRPLNPINRARSR